MDCEKKMIKTEERVRSAMLSHGAMLRAIKSDEKILKETAKRMGWSEERVIGYMEGINWAYEWFLGIGK